MSMRDTHAIVPSSWWSRPTSIRVVWTAFIAMAVFMTAGSAWGQQWNLVGSRAQGMGGAGVATVTDSTAQYWNPAAFGFKKRGEWDAQMPITINTSIENNVLQDISDLAFRTDDIEGILDAFEDPGASLPGLTQQQVDNAITWLNDLNALGEQPQSVHAEIGVGLLGHVGNIGFGGLSNTMAIVYPDVDLSNLGLSPQAFTDFLSVVPATGQQGQLKSDVEALGGFWDVTTSTQLVDAFVGAPGVDPNEESTRDFILTLADGVNNGGSFADNDSGVVTAGLSLQEFGISFGYALPSPVLKRWLDKKVSVGATAKYLMGIAFVRTARYIDDVPGSGLGDIGSFNDSEISHNFGLDLGIDYRPLPFARFGIVARNVNAPKFSAGDAFGDIRVHPQVRMGMSLMPLESFVIAMDVDLTKNKMPTVTRNVPSSDYRSRMLSLGTEYSIPMGKPVELALRFGTYKNTVSSIEEGWALTGGLGLRLYGFWLDLSAGGGLERERIRIDEFDYVNVPDRLNVGLGLKWEKSI